MSLYSVWVGGGEINSYHLTKDEAHNLAQVWKDKGYQDATVAEAKCTDSVQKDEVQ